MNNEKRLNMSEEEARKRLRELLNLPKEDLLTQYLFLEQETQELKEKLKEITKLIRNIIDNDEEVDIYTLFGIQDIIKDKDDMKVQYEKYIKPYID